MEEDAKLVDLEQCKESCECGEDSGPNSSYSGIYVDQGIWLSIPTEGVAVGGMEKGEDFPEKV